MRRTSHVLTDMIDAVKVSNIAADVLNGDIKILNGNRLYGFRVISSYVLGKWVSYREY